MSLLINAISAVGNNSSVYPLLVRDCAIEGPTKIVQNYNQTAKDSKRMAYAQICLRKENFPPVLLEFGAQCTNFINDFKRRKHEHTQSVFPGAIPHCQHRPGTLSLHIIYIRNIG